MLNKKFKSKQVMIIKQEIVGKSSKVRYQKNKLWLDVSHQANFNPNIDARLKVIKTEICMGREDI